MWGKHLQLILMLISDSSNLNTFVEKKVNWVCQQSVEWLRQCRLILNRADTSSPTTTNKPTYVLCRFPHSNILFEQVIGVKESLNSKSISQYVAYFLVKMEASKIYVQATLPSFDKNGAIASYDLNEIRELVKSRSEEEGIEP